MTKTVWKYELNAVDEQTLLIEPNGRVLCVDTQSNKLMLWVMVNPKAKPISRTFLVCGTGHYRDDIDDAHYIGTAMQFGSELVWHVFEKVARG